jgi:hypothetical protein
MDSCERKDDKQKGETKREIGDPLPNVVPLLQSPRIRRNIQDATRLDGFLLAYGSGVLPYCGIISWILFLLLKN